MSDDDLIRRDRLIEAVRRCALATMPIVKGEHAVGGVCDAIRALPAHADPVRDAALRLAEEAHKHLPLVKAGRDHLTWDCPACGSRCGMTLSGDDIAEECEADCWLAPIEDALNDYRAAKQAHEAEENK